MISSISGFVLIASEKEEIPNTFLILHLLVRHFHHEGKYTYDHAGVQILEFSKDFNAFFTLTN